MRVVPNWSMKIALFCLSWIVTVVVIAVFFSSLPAWLEPPGDFLDIGQEAPNCPDPSSGFDSRIGGGRYDTGTIKETGSFYQVTAYGDTLIPDDWFFFRCDSRGMFPLLRLQSHLIVWVPVYGLRWIGIVGLIELAFFVLFRAVAHQVHR